MGGGCVGDGWGMGGWIRGGLVGDGWGWVGDGWGWVGDWWGMGEGWLGSEGRSQRPGTSG